MNAKSTIMQYVIAATVLLVCLTANKAQAQDAVRAIENDSQVQSIIDRMGKDKFIETARKNPAFLESFEIRLEGMRGIDMETRGLLDVAKFEATLNNVQKKKMKAMDNHKWLASYNWYSTLYDGSDINQLMLDERTYFMYAEDEEGNFSTNEISQTLDDDWQPNYVGSYNEAADGNYFFYKYYEDYSNTGWNYQMEYEYLYNDMGMLEMTSYYDVYAAEGDIESEHVRSNYTYDENGYRDTIIDEYREGDVWYNDWKRDYDYDADGVWLQWTDYQWMNNDWLKYRDIINSYNEDGSWNNQVVEFYDEETGELTNKVKYELVNDSDGNIIEEYYYVWDFETEAWGGPYYRWLYTNDSNGNLTEFVFQYRDSETEEWINLSKAEYSYNAEGYLLTYYWSGWNSETQEWVLNYGYENEFNENSQRTKSTTSYYYEGVLDYSYTTNYEYDAEGYIVKGTSSYSNGETTYYDGYWEYNYATEMPVETPFLSIASLADRPDDQGGYIEIALDGLYVGSTDLSTKYWLVWVRNGENWENIHRSEYFEGVGSTATVPVYDTKPSDEEPDASNTFQFMVTAHGAGGAILAATPISAGYAEDNIAPAKVNAVTSTVNEVDNTISFSWNATADSDVDGYHVYLLEEGEFDSENSLGFSKSTNIDVPRPIEQGDYQYVVVAIDENRNYGQASDAVMVSFATSNELAELPVEFQLSQNYPNPFNPTTNIAYSLPEASEVRLSVYDMVGREVATIVNGRKQAGNHTAQFDATNLSSGMYIYRIEAGSFTKTRQMMLIK